MRRTKGTGCITQMKSGKYKYRGILKIGINKNGNPKNKLFYGNTKKEVEEKIMAYLNQDEPKLNNDLIFNDALDMLYVQSKKDRVKQKTLSIIETTSKILRNKWGNVSIAHLYKTEIESQFLIWENEYSFSQLQKLRNYGKKAFRIFTDKYELSIKNPFDIKLKAADEAPRLNYFSEEEIQLINQHISGVYESIPEFLYETGLRINECLALTFGDVDYDNKTIDVNKTLSETKQANGKYQISVTTPKSKLSYRKVPLTQIAKDIVYFKDQGYAKSDDLIFPSSNGTFLSARNVLRAFDNAMKKANVEKKHRGLHSIRHSCIIRLFKEMSTNGRSREIDAIDISKIVGNRVDVSAYIYDLEQIDRANRILKVLEDNKIKTYTEEPEIANKERVFEHVHIEFAESELESAIADKSISNKEKELFKKFAYRCFVYNFEHEILAYPTAGGQLCRNKELWERFKRTGKIDSKYIDTISHKLTTEDEMREIFECHNIHKKKGGK